MSLEGLHSSSPHPHPNPDPKPNTYIHECIHPPDCFPTSNLRPHQTL